MAYNAMGRASVVLGYLDEAQTPGRAYLKFRPFSSDQGQCPASARLHLGQA